MKHKLWLMMPRPRLWLNKRWMGMNKTVVWTSWKIFWIWNCLLVVHWTQMNAFLLTLKEQRGEWRDIIGKKTLYFQNLVVFKPKDRFLIVKKMHNEIGHFGDALMFVEIKKCFFWHDRTHLLKSLSKLEINANWPNKHMITMNMFLLLFTTTLSSVKHIL